MRPASPAHRRRYTRAHAATLALPCNVVALLVALLVGLRALAADSPQPPPPSTVVATCGAVEGDVQIERASVGWIDAQPGAPLAPGDRIEAGRLGFSRLDVPGGGGVRIADGTTVRFLAQSALVVEAGSARGFIEGASNKRFAFQTSEGAAGFIERAGDRSVQFRLTRIGDITELAVLQGEALIGVTGSERRLEAGQYIDIARGEPTEAKPLLAPPELSSPDRDARFFCPGLVTRLKWAAASTATGYRVQVATDAAFHSLLFSRDVVVPHLVFAPPGVGRYTWRVAARDPNHRWSDFGEPQSLFCEAAPPTDLLLSPAKNATSVGSAKAQAVTFTWKPYDGARGYHLVLSRSPNLHAPDATRVASLEPRAELPELAAGTYYWGVYADEFQPIFLEPRRLTRKMIGAPGVKVPEALKNWGK